jgi:hypothetical protein
VIQYTLKNDIKKYESLLSTFEGEKNLILPLIKEMNPNFCGIFFVLIQN